MARNDLHVAELELRRRIEAFLQYGGSAAGWDQKWITCSMKEAGTCGNSTSACIRLSQLFQPGKDSLILYSFVYRPEMKQAHTSCTSILDRLNVQYCTLNSA